jgi:hypothetical protein
VLRLLATGLAFLEAVDLTEADPFRAFFTDNSNRVAVENTDHVAGELAGYGGSVESESEESHEDTTHRPHASRLVIPLGGDHSWRFSRMRIQ